CAIPTQRMRNVENAGGLSRRACLAALGLADAAADDPIASARAAFAQGFVPARRGEPVDHRLWLGTRLAGPRQRVCDLAHFPPLSAKTRQCTRNLACYSHKPRIHNSLRPKVERQNGMV